MEVIFSFQLCSVHACFYISSVSVSVGSWERERVRALELVSVCMRMWDWYCESGREWEHQSVRACQHESVREYEIVRVCERVSVWKCQSTWQYESLWTWEHESMYECVSVCVCVCVCVCVGVGGHGCVCVLAWTYCYWTYCVYVRDCSRAWEKACEKECVSVILWVGESVSARDYVCESECADSREFVGVCVISISLLEHRKSHGLAEQCLEDGLEWLCSEVHTVTWLAATDCHGSHSLFPVVFCAWLSLCFECESARECECESVRACEY
jgi:hypothetical protein